MSYIPSVAQGVVSSADFKDFIATNEQLILKIEQMEAEKSDCLAVVSSSREECRMKIAAICQRLIYRIEELQQISITDADTKHDVEEATIQNDIDTCAELKVQLHDIKQQMQPRQPINEPALFVKMKVGQKCHQKCKQSCECLSKSQMKTFEFQEDPGTLRASLPDTVGECIEKKSLDNFIVSYKDQDIINKVGSFKKQGKIVVTGRRGRHLGPQLDTSTPDTDTVHVLRTGFDWNHDASDLKTFEMKEGITVKVYKAKLLKAPVDCIVNAANEYLSHGAGVAKAIADAAGRSLVTEGDKIVKKMGKVQVGIAVATTAGDLQFKCVIHTVGPSWSDYRPFRFEDIAKCEKDLYSAIMHSFLEAERRGLRSIALPAISSAIFGVPEEICTYQYAKATIDYSRNSVDATKRLKEIHFVDINANMILRIQKMFDEFITEGKPPDYDIQTFVKSSKGFDDIKIKEPPIEKAQYYGEPVIVEVNEHGKPRFYFGEGNELSIYRANIFDVHSDAITCVVNASGNAASRIAFDVENKIEHRNRAKYRKQIQMYGEYHQHGHVIQTIGYESGFSHILHVVLPGNIESMTVRSRKDILKTGYMNVLELCQKREISSAALSHLGTDSNLSTQAFFDTCLEFSRKKRFGKRKLKLFFVCVEKEKSDIVYQTFHSYAANSNDKTTSGAKSNFQHTVSLATGHSTRLVTHTIEETETEEEKNITSDESCVICMDKVTNPKTMSCGHVFCTECIEMQIKYKPSCPTCSKVFGVITGDQPEGSLVPKRDYKSCAGYEGYGTISITYIFPSGLQGANHPNPGKWYEAISRTAYLPDNEEGNIVFEMLKIAFNRKLVFTIGSSRTNGQEGVITWNDIHHKTNPNPRGKFGYPDAEYLTRVTDELAAKGVTKEDIQKETLRDIQNRFRSHSRIN